MREQLSDIREHVVSPDSKPNAFFEQSKVPRFILHLDLEVFVHVNKGFQSLFGYQREKFLNGSVTAYELIAPGDRKLLRLVQRHPDHTPSDFITIRGLKKSGSKFPVKVSVCLRTIEGHDLLYGSLREISDTIRHQKQQEEALNKAVRCNKQLRTLLDKLRNVPDVSAELLKKTHEVGVLTRAQSKLCERTGMNFADVRFFQLDESGDQLKRPFPEKTEDSNIPDNLFFPAMKVARRNTEVAHPDEDVLILPLDGRQQRIGVVVFTIPHKERQLLEEEEYVWTGFKEMLSILAKIIGLLVENCRLTKRALKEAIKDPLTDIFNRRHMNEELEREVYRSRRYDDPLSVMIIDADNFKHINDTYGHQEGDRIIQQIAQTLEASIRNSDTLCRYGGDEFAIVLPTTSGEEAKRKAKMMEEQFQQNSFTVNEEEDDVKEILVHLSIGISSLSDSVPDSGEGSSKVSQSLLLAADQSMYKAKTSEGTSVVHHELSEN